MPNWFNKHQVFSTYCQKISNQASINIQVRNCQNVKNQISWMNGREQKRHKFIKKRKIDKTKNKQIIQCELNLRIKINATKRKSSKSWDNIEWIM